MTLWKVRATLDDRPGFLAVLTASLALRSINILAVQVHATEEGAVDEFLVDAPDLLTEEQLRDAVKRGRGRDAWVARADARGLADPPTQVLGLAARLVRDPDALGPALATLLGGADVTWRPATSPPRLASDTTRMVLPDPSGGSFLIERDAPVFTPAEYARAQALVGLAEVADRRSSVRLLLPDGIEVDVRPAEVEDADAVRRMHERCGAATRHRRYLSGTSGPSPAQIARLLDPRRGQAFVAEVGETVIALGNLVGEGSVAEIALLVEDAWQRRGIGTALLRRLVAQAGRSSYAAVMAHTHADNMPMLSVIRRLGLPLAYDRDGSVLTVTVTLDGRAGSGLTWTASAGPPTAAR